MPLFDYYCDKCDKKEEILVFSNEKSEVNCEVCNENMKPLLGIFKTRKGAGLYSLEEPEKQNLGYFEED